MISFEIDLFDLLPVQGTLKGLLQHHNWKASILRHSAFFMVQRSQPYGTTEKTIALTIWTFVSKVMALLFNTLSRFVIAFLPRSNHFLISWLQLFAVYITQLVKNPPAMQETVVRFLSLEDPLKKELGIHSNILGLPSWLNW